LDGCSVQLTIQILLQSMFHVRDSIERLIDIRLPVD
jgi:hypothetical protein